MRRVLLGGDTASPCSDYQCSLEEIASVLAAKLEALQGIVIPGLLEEGSTVEEAECKKQYEVLIDIRNSAGVDADPSRDLTGDEKITDEIKEAVTAPKKTKKRRRPQDGGSQHSDTQRASRRSRLGSNADTGQ